jgi:hypothetical protein
MSDESKYRQFIIWSGVVDLAWVQGSPCADYYEGREWKPTEVRIIRLADDQIEMEYVRSVDRFGCKQWKEGIYEYQRTAVLQAAFLETLDNLQRRAA